VRTDRQPGNMQSMNAELLELTRLLHNMIRFGTIAEVANGRARVRLSPKLTTTWLRWAALRAGDARSWWPPSVGEQVVLLSPGGDLTAGVIVPAIYSNAFPAPSDNPTLHTTHYPDGAVVQYDYQAHTLGATLPDGTSVTVAPGKVTSNAEDTECTGNLLVQKNLVVNQNLTVNGLSALNAGMNVQAGEGGGPAAIVQGVIQATMDMIAAGISLVKHPHGGVKKGDDDSGAPK
jgi:phage baseplate assembly protein V